MLVVLTRMTSATLYRPIVFFAFAALVTAPMVSPALGRTEDAGLAATIAFNIPAQPLSRALIAYGEVTGLEIFYKAELAEGRQSSAVVGRLSPADALRELLRGTGYLAKASGVGSITILPDPGRQAVVPVENFEPYFAIIQSRITAALCKRSDVLTGSGDLLLEISLDASGTVAQAKLLGDEEAPEAERAFAQSMQGLHIGAPPPSAMPQPVSIVVFPPTRKSSACSKAIGDRLRTP